MKQIAKITNFTRLLLSSVSSRYAASRIVLGYLLYALFGTLLLSLPFAHTVEVSFIDNLFNSMASISNTGLITINIADSYSFFGQLVILTLIQIGGVGFMTFSSFLLFASFHHVNFGGKAPVNTDLTYTINFTLDELVRVIIVYSIVIEALGALVLGVCFWYSGEPNFIWDAIFHSVSSFCTTGLSTFPSILDHYTLNVPVNITISLLSYLGGIGFIVVFDVWKMVVSKRHKMTFASKLILAITSVLVIFGTCVFFFAEKGLQLYTVGERFMISFFHTISAMTTTGYSTIPLSFLGLPVLLTIILLMFIGASPSSTGGGIKSTSLLTLYAAFRSKISDEDRVTMFNHTIPNNRVNTAVSTFMQYCITLFLAMYVLSFIENHSFVELLFEATAAISTVGLSMGITSDLTVAGKSVLIFVMLMGRTGIATFGAIFFQKLHLGKALSRAQ